MTPEQIAATLRLLAVERRTLESARAEQEAMLEQVKQQERFLELEEYRKSSVGMIGRLEAELREHAVEVFKETGEKHPHPALNILERPRVAYDLAAAVEYCKAHLPRFVTLDKAAFEKHAKAVVETDPLPCVTYFKEPTATIATDLTSYLPVQTDADSVVLDINQVVEIPF